MFWTQADWWKNWACPRVPCSLAPSWLLHNSFTHSENLDVGKDIWSCCFFGTPFRQTCLSSHHLHLIFSFLRLFPPPLAPPTIIQYMCMFIHHWDWNPVTSSNLINEERAIPPLPASFLSLSPQQGAFSLKHQNTKQRESVDVCPAIISYSLHVEICSALRFDVYNELTRGTPQEVCATLGLAR